MSDSPNGHKRPSGKRHPGGRTYRVAYGLALAFISTVVIMHRDEIRDVWSAQVRKARELDLMEPCQPIGCDNGIHLVGCQFAIIDSAQ